MALRHINCSEILTLPFIAICTYITFNYIVFVFLYMLDLRPSGYIVSLVFANALFLLLTISMARAVLTDPGRIPSEWQLFSEKVESENRTCKLCHAAKP